MQAELFLLSLPSITGDFLIDICNVMSVPLKLSLVLCASIAKSEPTEGVIFILNCLNSLGSLGSIKESLLTSALTIPRLPQAALRVNPSNHFQCLLARSSVLGMDLDLELVLELELELELSRNHHSLLLKPRDSLHAGCQAGMLYQKQALAIGDCIIPGFKGKYQISIFRKLLLNVKVSDIKSSYFIPPNLEN